MLFQRNPVNGTDQSVGWQNAGCWAPGDSLSADEFSDCIAIVISHLHSLPLATAKG